MNRSFCDVSVIVANFNHAALLPDLFVSILASSMWPKELIIVNDGSTDDSLLVIRSFLSYPFVKLIDLPENRGFAHALNTGIEAATGKYIARIDPDDFMLPDRLEKQYQFLESHPDLDVLGGNVLYFHGVTGQSLLMSNFPATQRDILRAYLAGDHGVQHPTVMVRAEVMRKYRYVQYPFPVEDYDLFARMIHDGHRFANLSQPLNRMRIHDGSVSNSVCFGTIQLTFQLRDKIFGGTTPVRKVHRYFQFILNYRRFLYAQHRSKKLQYLIMAVYCHPQKAWMKVRVLARRLLE